MYVNGIDSNTHAPAMISLSNYNSATAFVLAKIFKSIMLDSFLESVGSIELLGERELNGN